MGRCARGCPVFWAALPKGSSPPRVFFARTCSMWSANAASGAISCRDSPVTPAPGQSGAAAAPADSQSSASFPRVEKALRPSPHTAKDWLMTQEKSWEKSKTSGWIFTQRGAVAFRAAIGAPCRSSLGTWRGVRWHKSSRFEFASKPFSGSLVPKFMHVHVRLPAAASNDPLASPP